MIVARSGQPRRRIVEAGYDVDILLEGSERSQARRDRVVAAGLLGDPIFLDDAVAVEPADEAGLDRLVLAGRGGSHHLERWQSHQYRHAREGESLEQRTPREVIRFGHFPSWAEIPSTSLLQLLPL